MSVDLQSIQAIAFDLDGTLVDSVPGLTLALQRTLADLKLPGITDEQVKVWIGNGIDVLLQRAFAAIQAPTELLTEARQRFDHHYNQTIDQGTQLFPHVKQTLQNLQQRGFQLALVTNKPAQFLPALLASLQIKNYFSLCLGGGDVIKLKPHPAPIFQVLASFGLYQAQLLFVGDSRNDILCAQQAGCPTVALTYGYNYGEPIADSRPDFLLDDLAKLLTLLPAQPSVNE